ncbi:winged helix-turn-helix domain-containing protein [Streptomyces sp. x-80]|uniref:winged helix-turn-helix domain-containing protein n=1 Tax=Streptomyces sp. x-80 TaxID=2789282 RepID=UPI00397EA1AD
MTLRHRLVHRVYRDRVATAAESRRGAAARPVPRPSSVEPRAVKPPRAPVHRVRGLVVDCESRSVAVDGRQLELTCMEFELLAHLVANRRRVYSRPQLMELVWQQAPVGYTRTVDVHIARLRSKLGPGHRTLIRTVRQVGYAFDPANRAR